MAIKAFRSVFRSDIFEEDKERSKEVCVGRISGCSTFPRKFDQASEESMSQSRMSEESHIL